MHAFRKLPLHPSLKLVPLTHRQKVKALYKKSLINIETNHSMEGL